MYYVDNSAEGTNDGTSLANAWTSFGSIVQASLAGGDTVYVYPGTGAYDERYIVS